MDFSTLDWSTSTKSNGQGQCVEVAMLPDGAAVRDSKDPDGPVLVFSAGEWNAFVGGAKDGEFDL